MKWAQRVAGHVGGERIVAAGLFQRRGTAATIGDDGVWPPASTRNARRQGSRRTPSSR